MKTTKSYKEGIDDILIREKQYRDPDFSASKLAERLGVSVYQLSRIFQHEYGKTYTDIVHAYRIQEATRHLQDKRLSLYRVDDIGTMVGFKNRQSFFTAFKKATGQTPERFRQKL